jgi:hypothetical protein
MAAAAVGVLVLAIFQTQASAGELPHGERLEARGRLHDLGSGLATTCLLAAAATVALSRGTPRTLRASSGVAAVAAIATSVGLLAVGESVAGIRQRALILLAVLWQLVLTGAAARRTGHGPA